MPERSLLGSVAGSADCSYDQMDFCLYCRNHEMSTVSMSRAEGLTPVQVELTLGEGGEN